MTENSGKYHNKRENKKRVLFYCPYCGLGCKNKVELSIHMLSCKRG